MLRTTVAAPARGRARACGGIASIFHVRWFGVSGALRLDSALGAFSCGVFLALYMSGRVRDVDSAGESGVIPV